MGGMTLYQSCGKINEEDLVEASPFALNISCTELAAWQLPLLSLCTVLTKRRGQVPGLSHY